MYTSTSIFSFRTRSYVTYSHNDSYCFNGRCPSCCCACNSSFPISYASTKLYNLYPSFLYGLRQSTLIHLAPSRRLILGACGDRCCCRSSIYDVGEEPCCIKDKSSQVVGRKKGNGRYRYKVFEERLEMGRAGSYEDAEAVLSLLTEDVSEECLDVRGRKGRVVKESKVARRGSAVNESGKGRKDSVSSGYEKKGVSKSRMQLINAQARVEVHEREEREGFLMGEEGSARRGGSSSSYYSLPDSDDLESDIGVEAWNDEISRESLKDSRKRIGVDEEFEMQADERHKHFEAKRNGVVKAGNSSDWDCRKKSEKKLTDESMHEATSRNDSSRIQSKVSRVRERSLAKASTSEEQLKSVSVANLQKDSAFMENRVSEYSKSSLKHDNSNYTVTTSGPGIVIDGSKENVCSRGYCKTCGQVTGEDNIGKHFKQHVKRSEIQEKSGKITSTVDRGSEARLKQQEEKLSSLEMSIKQANEQSRHAIYLVDGQVSSRRNSQKQDETHARRGYAEIASSSQGQSETRMKRLEENSASFAFRQQEEKSNLLETSGKQAKEQHLQATYTAGGKVNSRRNTVQYDNVSYGAGTYAEGASSSQSKSEDRVKYLEENASSLISLQEAGQQNQAGANDVAHESRKSSKDIRSRLAQSGEVDSVTNSQINSKKSLHIKDSYLTSKVELVEQQMEKHEEVDLQTRVRNKLQRPIKQQSSHENLRQDATASFAGLSSQNQVCQIGEEDDTRVPLLPLIPPPSQLVERDPTYVESEGRFARQDSTRTSEAGSSSIYADPLSGTSSSHGEGSGYERSDPPHAFSHEDALGSAQRMENSSVQIIGEFVENIRHEKSISVIHREKLIETESVREGKKQAQGLASEAGSGGAHLKKQDSRRSSGGSGAKGPSDEMWDVRDPSVKESPEKEVSEGTMTSGNDTVRRTGRSFWNFIGEMFRLRWGTHAEARKSNTKSGGQGLTSLSGSVGSDAGAYSHDPEEASNDSSKRDRTGMPELTAVHPLARVTPTQSQKETFSVVSPEDKVKHVDVSLSSKSRSGAISEEQNADPNSATKGSQATSSVTLPLPAAIKTGAHSTEEVSEVIRSDGLGGARAEQIEHRIDLRLPHVSDSDGNDSELRRRKFQRTNQVVKDRFDEWEVAYRYESEQRKIDEMFMKEALAEAKKAADIWEVPVGAVLVQNGRIIGRGHNLVEELRDSTAHAEMMCIREASNILKTWRLSGTTLYVTLEPCPMCAGAILQARIDTLVWGAPNKLLGADGSWIRLFPNGGEGDTGSEPTDKPAAPVHPFHPKMTIRRGILEAECAEAMQQFFQLRRKKQKKVEPPAQPSCLPVPHHPSKLFHKMHDAFHMMFCL